MSEQSPPAPIDILLVEDNVGDIRLTEIALEGARVRNDLHVVSSGPDALDYLNQRGAYATADRPDIVLLDLNLPGMSGIQVLEAIKTDPELKVTPVIVLTSSETEDDVIKSYDEHANAYLTKPLDPGEFIDLARSLGEFWAQMASLPDAGS